MPARQCPNCGLSNPSTHPRCVRCYTTLEGAPESPAPTTVASPLPNPRQKMFLIGGLAALFLVVLVVCGIILAFSLRGRGIVPNPNAAFEAAIRDSAEFNVPVTVEVGRYTFLNQDEHRFDQEATPAAYTLDQLGLLHVHNGLYSDTPMNVASNGGMIVDQKTGMSWQQYRHIELEVTSDGQAQSASWEHYEDKTAAKVGWRVSIGERQFGRVIEMRQNPDRSPLGEGSTTFSFTWKWKPNEIGQSFDKRSPSFFKPDKAKNFPRSSFEVYVDDSQAVYWGLAEMHRVNDHWEINQLTWSGPGGISISSGDLDKIDKIIRDSQTAPR